MMIGAVALLAACSGIGDDRSAADFEESSSASVAALAPEKPELPPLQFDLAWLVVPPIEEVVAEPIVRAIARATVDRWYSIRGGLDSMTFYNLNYSVREATYNDAMPPKRDGYDVYEYVTRTKSTLLRAVTELFVQHRLWQHYHTHIAAFLAEMDAYAGQVSAAGLERAALTSEERIAMYGAYRDAARGLRDFLVKYRAAPLEQRLACRSASETYTYIYDRYTWLRSNGERWRRDADRAWEFVQRTEDVLHEQFHAFGELPRAGGWPAPAVYVEQWTLRRERDGSLDDVIRVLNDLVPRLERRATGE